MLRDEVSNRMDALSESVVGTSHKLESALENNLRILRATGATDVRLAELAASIRSSARQPVHPTTLPPDHAGPLAQPTDMEEQQPSIDRALPPQCINEPNEDFERHARAALNRQESAAGTFQATCPATPSGQGFIRQEPPHLAKHAQFDAMESASTAGVRRTAAAHVRVALMGINQSPSGYLTQPLLANGQSNIFEIFLVMERQLGETMEAPPKAPRMRDPPMYKGEDNNESFMVWLGRLATFLQGYSLGGPKYDANHIVYLKSALDSHALEWFVDEVEPVDRDSDIPYDFESIICAMHWRFVTTATATKATKDFEDMRYDPIRGIEFLVSELRRTAGKMREPPAEFTIRQRFMRLIPSDAHDELISRGMRPEYTELNMLKTNVRVWIESRSMMRGEAARTAPRIVQRTGTPRGVPPKAGTARVVSWAPSHATPTGPALTPLRAAAINPPRSTTSMSGTARLPVPNAAKTCFSCGLVGHIASDPKCPRFSDSASRAPRPALRAGRVESSYSVDGDGERDVDPSADEGPTEDELDGTWGSDQYDTEELVDRYNYPAEYNDDQGVEVDDPNEAPDLDTLINDGKALEIRVGVMRPVWRYFSMRVQTTDPEPNRVAAVAHGSRQLTMDTDVTIFGVREDGHELWTADSKHQATSERGVGWDTGLVSHDQLVTAFYEQHGSGAPTEAGALDLSAVDATGAEEIARDVWLGVLQMQPLMVVGFSPEYLRLAVVNVGSELLRFDRLFGDIRQTIEDLRTLLRQRQLARVGLRDLRSRSEGSNSRAPQLVERALSANRSLINDINLSIHVLEHRLSRVGRTQISLEEEETCQALEREEFNSLLNLFSPRERPDGDAPTNPPSYPGSPHDSDEYYPADEGPLLSRVNRDNQETTSSPPPTPSTPHSSLDNSTESSVTTEYEPETLAAAPYDRTPQAPLEEEVILHSVEVLTSRNARRVTTYVTPMGELRVAHSALPQYHHLNPGFQEEHRCTMSTAIVELAEERHRSRVYADRWVDWESAPEENSEGEVIREINGFPDPLDGIFQG
ncbi:hypothetical protein K438DRAFT_1998232 [Mycena galopus ATCC 62051]|nr:hypothetical protein K438DRAFT_1998232 [Mycena galopus ATCC 62051]